MSRREYHFVITLQFTRKGEYGAMTNTVNGTVTAKHGATRQDLYQDVLDRALDGLGITEGVTLFCSIERNDL